MVKYRYIFAFLGAWVMGIIYSTKVCMSIALIAMLNYTALQKTQKNSSSNHTTVPTVMNGPFVWDVMEQQMIIGSYFIGYLISEIPSGFLAENWSAKWMLSISMILNTLCFLLIPPFAYLGFIPVIVLRIGQGLGGGCSFPAMHCMLAKWVPKEERSFINSIVYTGTSLGVVLANLASGLIATYLGWAYIFYTFGGMSLLITILWTALIGDSPETQNYFMDMAEIEFITLSLGDDHLKHHSVPYSMVFRNVPFLAILLAHTCSNFGWYISVVEFPIYMKNVLNIHLEYNAVHSSVPYLLLWIFSTCLGMFLDYQIRKENYNTTKARKIATGISSIGPAICMIIICALGTYLEIVTIIIIYLAIMMFGAMFSGFLCTHIDISPHHAGLLMAITNTVATIPGIMLPLLVAVFTGSNIHDAANWRPIFFITIFFLVVEFIVFQLWGSGELQNLDEV